jgi:hypothetical protein
MRARTQLDAAPAELFVRLGGLAASYKDLAPTEPSPSRTMQYYNKTS